MSDNKDLVKRVYDNLNSLAPGMPYTEESLGRNLKKESFAKDIFKFASDRFGANLLGAPDEKSFLDSLGLNKPVKTIQETPKQTEAEKAPAMGGLQVEEPTQKMEPSMFKTPDLSISVPDSLRQKSIPFNPEQSFSIRDIIGETPQQRIQAEINSLGEDAVMDSAKVGALKEDIQKQIASINSANEKFLKEYETNMRDANVNSENMHHDSWSPMMPWSYKKNKEAGEYIKQNSAKYDKIQKQKQALQRQYDLLETYGQYADFGRSVEVGKRLSAMVGSGAISEDTMKILRSTGNEEAKEQYLGRLLQKGKIDKDTIKEIYNLGDLTEKNGLGYGLFKTGKAADMLTFGVNEIAREMDIANIANRVNAGQEVSAEEMDVLSMYLKLGKIKEKAQKDFGFWFNAGMGMQESLRFMAEMALTGGVGTVGKQLGVQGAKSLIQQFGMKSALKTIAKNVGEVALKSAGKQALLTPITPSAYRHFSERLTGLAVEGKDVSGWDKVGELYKSYAQTFAERFSESLGNIASDVPLWTMLNKGKATRDLTNRFVRTFAEITDNEAFKQSADLLKNVGITGIPEEVLSELSGNLMTAALTWDSEALKDFVNPEFYGQVALQSAIMGGMGGVVNYTAGGIGSAIHNKKMKDQYERSMDRLNSTSFNHQALEDLRVELMDALRRQDYINEDESAQQRPVADIIRDMNTIFDSSTTTPVDAKAMDIVDNAVKTGAYRYGEQQAIKSYVEDKIGAFENEDGNVYEVTDTNGTKYFVLDSTDDIVVLHNRNTGEKEVKRKDYFSEGAIKQTNGNEWAVNEFLLNINRWNQENNTQEQVKSEGFIPATHIDLNGQVIPVKSYDPQTGKYTISDENGNEVEVSGTDEGVTEIWGNNPQGQVTNTINTPQEGNTAESTDGNVGIEPEPQPEEETPSNEQNPTEDVVEGETTEPTEEIEYDENGDPVWSKTSPERGKQEIDSAFDEDEAKAFVADKIKAAEKAVKSAEKKKPKAGNIRDRKAEIEQIKAEREQAKANLDYWNAMSQLYNAQPVEEAPVAETGQTTDVPLVDDVRDNPVDARARGYRSVEGVRYDRQQPMQTDNLGNDVEVKFAEGVTSKGKRGVIEADEAQPSHINGVRNPRFFLNEAQPKDRTDKVSMTRADRIAQNIRPEEITGGVTAYTGSPVVNTRKEAIQGNNRLDALKKMYQNHPEQAAIYKQYLIDHATEWGLDPQAIAAMNAPILVDVIDVTDEEAIKLGQRTSQDTESGGVQAISAQNVAQTLGSEMKNLAGILFRSEDEEASIDDLIEQNGYDTLKWLAAKKVITETQMQTALDANGNLTPQAKQSLKDVLSQVIFKGGNNNIRKQFAKLPKAAQKALLQTIARELDSTDDNGILSDIQEAIEIYSSLMNDPDFKAAKGKDALMAAAESWSKQMQMDFTEGNFVPEDRYSKFALALAVSFKAETMKQQTEKLNQLYDYLQAEGGDIFNPAVKLSKADAVKEVYGDELKDKQDEKDVKSGDSVPVNAEQESTDGGQGSSEGPGLAQQNEQQSESTDSTGRPGESETGVSEVENENPLFRAKSDEEIAELDKVYEKYQERLNNVDIHIARYKKAGMSIPQAFMNERRKVIEAFLSEVLDIPYTVATRADFVSKMQEAGCSQKQIDNAIDALSEYSIPGFYVRGQIFFITDDIADIEDARQTLVHERQHYLTSKDRARLTNAVLESVDSVEELDKVVENLSETDLYVGEDADVLADEFLSFAMQIAYTDANFAEILKEKGVNDKLITLITEINNGQANQESLSKARRGRGRNVYGSQSSNRSSKQDGGNQTAQSARVEEQRPGSSETGEDGVVGEQIEPRYSKRTKPAPKNTGKGYKVFVLKDGKLYPPMVANPNGEATPVGVWLDADAAPISGQSKTGRNQVKAGGKGTQGGSGSLAYRPGWHLGEIPYALQFNRKNPNTGEKELFPANFVWAEVEYADDVNYQEEAMNQGVNQNGKFQHSLAGLQRVPEDGSYRYRTNPNPETDPWIITGAMKVNRILTPSEVDVMVREAGREPQQRQEGAITDEQVNKLNTTLGLSDSNRAGEDNQGNPINGEGDYILTEVDDISEITDDDFINPTRNIKLPALPKNVNDAIGGNNKPVIIKRNIFIKNRDTHKELLPQDGRDILSNALYNPNLVGQTQPIRKPNYKVAVHTADKNSVVILDVYENNKNIEIIGWRKISNEGLERMKKQAKREGGQFLILSPENRSAAALSTLPSDLLSDDKDNQKTNTNKSSDKKVQSDKNKALDYISVPAPIAGAQYSQELDSATKVIESFENPTINNENGSEDDIRFRSTKPFYSNAEKAVEGVKQDKATSFQWIAMLSKNGGLKAAEDKWLGLSDWLREQKGPVTKQQILDFIEQNKIQIEEVHYTDAENLNESLTNSLTEKYGNQFFKAFYIESWQDYPQAMIEDLQSAVELYNQYNEDKIENNDDLTDEQWDKMLDWGQKAVDNAYNNAKVIDSTRLDYTTAGLENKKEIALTVPTIEPWNENDNIHFGDAGNGRAVAWIRFGDTTTPIEDANSKRRKEITDRLDELSMKVYSGGLTVDEFNERANLRKELDDMPENENQKVLVIDEIQSKRHQEGREKGYIPKGIRNVGIRMNDISDRLDELGKIESESANGLTDEQIEEQVALLKEQETLSKSGTIPAAPFEKNWHELAMKRMLRYAAENGYDKIAWTTGEQQAQRYSLGRFFSSIERQDNPSMEGRRFVLYGGNMDSFMVNDEGIIIESTINESINRPLSDVVGKELSVKMMQMKDGDELEDADIVVGGEGMKGFYDKMLVDFMNKYGKKWGVKVQDLKLQDLGETMHSMDVTDAMVDSVMEGQPMFRGKSKRSVGRPAGYKTNTLEMSFTDKLLHSIQDRMRPVKKIMDEIVKRGGVIDETSDPHSQEFLSASRAASEIEDFKFSKYEPLAKAIADAMKVFTDRFGMTAEDARTAVNEYLYARHAPERNKRICVNEIVEAGLKLVAHKDAVLVNEAFKAELRRLAEQLYDNQFRGGKNTITPSGLSAEQTKLAMILAGAMQNKTVEISREQARDEDTGTMVLVANNRSGMSDAEAEDTMNRFYTSETKAALDEVSAKVKDCTNFTLDKWLEYGLISRDEYNAYQNQYEYYIPLRGWDEKGEDIDYLEIPSKQFNQASELINLNRYAKGRLSKAADPLAYIASLAQSACVTGNRNLIRQMAFNMVSKNEKLMADLAVIENTYEIYDDAGNIIGYSKVAPSQALFDQGRVKIIADKDYRWHKTGSELGAHRVPVMIDGVRHTIYFKGKLGALAATAINGTDNDTRNVLMQGAAKTTRFISANLTARNIAFLTKNLIRDLGFGSFAYFVENGMRDTAKMHKEFFSAMRTAAMDAMNADKATYADSALYDEFKKNGGQTGYVHLDDLNKLSKEMNKMIEDASNNRGKVSQEAVNAKDVLFQTFDVLGKASENAMRFAIYKMERQRGATPREAAIRAKEITVNFNRQGKNTKYFSSVYAFFNPAVQGAYRFGNLIAENPKRATTTLLALAAIKFGLGMMCEMFSGGDDDEPKGESAYDRLSDYVKATNWVIPLGWLPGEDNDDKFLCIPLPQSVRAITHISDMAVDMVYGRKTYLEAMRENALFSAGEFLPFDIDAIDLSSDNPWGTILQAASPTLARPIVENILNRDFMGNPITKEPFVKSQDYIPQYQLAFRTTSPILVGTSKFLNELAGGDEMRSAKYQISENGQVTESGWGSFMDVNPAKIEHLFSGYFGGMFNPLIEVYDTMRGVVSKDIETQIESISIANQFIKGPTSKPGYKKFYDMRDEAQMITNMNNLYKEAYTNENYRPLKSNRFNIEIMANFKVYNDALQKVNENIALINSNSDRVQNYNEKRKELEAKRDALILEAANKYREICDRRDKQIKDNTDETNTGNRN